MIRKLQAILTPSEIRKFALLLIAIVVMGFFELAGIASIMPFMQLVSQPDAISHNEWLQSVYAYFDFESQRQFLFGLGIFVLVLLAIANILTVVTIWLQYKFAWESGHSIAMRLLNKYLYQPYSFFLSQNTSQLSKQILSEVNDFARGFLLSVAVLIAKSFVALVIFTLLLLVDPMLAVTMFTISGLIYGTIYTSTRKYLKRLGETKFEANELRFKTANEAFGSIKMLKVSGKEQFFSERFATASQLFCRVEPRWEATFIAPVYFVQTLAFGAILVLILYLLATERGLQDVIPLLSLYALAGYRLLPSLQQIYGALAKIRYQRPIVDAIYKDLVTENEAFDQEMGNDGAMVEHKADRQPFRESIALKDLSFKYPTTREHTIKNVNLTLLKKQCIAFVGSTGSGKTTLVDIITGLLRPTAGAIYIDGEPLTQEQIRLWQNQIGYVPQDVVLYDDTVARNIAFGNCEEDIDMEQVRKVAGIAGIHAFIEGELAEGYNTIVGEQGIRLSGGQRQRIGLARALYLQPEVLVLDEATSALDGITEKVVMQGIAENLDEVTTIMIAHRLDTVKNCDCIYMLDRGRIVLSGRYKDLIQESDLFRKMASVGPKFKPGKVWQAAG